MPESRFSPQVRIPFSILQEHLDFINEHKLNIEVYFDANTLDSTDIAEVRELAGRLAHKPLITVHGPFNDLSPAAIDKDIKEVL